MYDNTLATKALLLSSSIKIRNRIMNSGDPVLVEDYLEWIELKDQMTKALALNPDQQIEENDPKVIQEKIEEIEKQLSQRSNLFDETGDADNPDWKDIRDQLEKNEVALEVVRFRKFDKVFTDEVVYAGLAVSRKTRRAPMLAVVNNGNDLEKKNLAYYRAAVEFGIDDKLSYNAYWSDIFDITGSGKTVYVSAEGVYNQINLETLVDSTGTYLLDKQNLYLVSTTKDLIQEKEEKPKNKKEPLVADIDNIQMIGNPIFYADLPESFYNRYNSRPITQLPGTYEEVKKLQNLLQATNNYELKVFTNTEATEEVVKNMESPKVFHIATHGFFLEDQEQEGVENDLAKEKAVSNPLLRSGLLLRNAGDLMASKNVYAFNKAPGVLTAYEAMNLNLDNTELVVLSACETGRGDNKVGEGVYGLQRAFLVAGAETIIMSLFEVSDVATMRLMELFYENWINKGMNKRDAFVMAKRTLRSEFEEPKFWGAFIMIGTA
jgi:CHAT domain-containing protein